MAKKKIIKGVDDYVKDFISNQFTKPQEEPPSYLDAPIPIKTAASQKPAVPLYTDQEKGEVTGFEKDGKTFFRPPGISDEEWFGTVEKLSAKEARKTAIPEGAVTKKQLAQEKLGAELAGGVGQLNPEIVKAGELSSEIDIEQALSAGLVTAAPGVVAGGAAGLLGGPGAPITVPLGAGIGAGLGFLQGVKSNIAAQRRGTTSASKQGLADGEKNIRKIITAANKNPADAAEYQNLFNEQLSYIERDYGKLKLDTQGYIKDITGVDGTPELADYQRFYDVSRDFYIREMQTALLNPDPAKILITPEDLE